MGQKRYGEALKSDKSIRYRKLAYPPSNPEDNRVNGSKRIGHCNLVEMHCRASLCSSRS